jgi:hypothetical protein
MSQLRPHLHEEEFVSLVREQEQEKYLLISHCNVEGAVVAVAGVRFMTTLIHGLILTSTILLLIHRI